ncbi:ABC transporter ATP-binding protein [Bacillus massilinigeriensis]|uniref:ABC transporter ATP-binding protein n=1 Tax=Bacillus mediterraneensis TaxID=1805474 RepID=UPI0008F8C4FF|nr:ABC transporter ATP-binding protein [Bacillus mediterraneensis]
MIAEIKDISKVISNKEILKNISFEIGKGEVIALVGPNGAGKTTLLNTLTYLSSFNKGTILFEGMDKQKSPEIIFKNVSYMQDASILYKELNGMDHLRFTAKINGKSKKDIESVIKKLDIGEYVNKSVSKYSLGMKQHLLLSLSLLTSPKLLIMDEPLNGLDPTNSVKLRNLILDLKKEGTSILLSSHILSEVDKVADRVLFMNKGEIISTTEIKKDDAPMANRYIIKVDDNKKVLKALNNYKLKLINSNSFEIEISELNFNNVIECLLNNKVKILDINKTKIGTELIYNNLYGEVL